MRSLSFLQKNKQFAIHVAGWLTFIAYEISFITIMTGAKVSGTIWNSYVIPYIINIALFYFHAFVIMQFSFGGKRKRPLIFIVLVFIETFCYLSLVVLKDFSYLTNKHDFLSTLFQTKIGFFRQLWRGIYFLIFSTAFWLIHQSFKKEQMLKEAETRALLRQQEKKELELRLVSAQNAFLQSQINPHLLFNTLNFIHSEVQQVSPKASEAIITLSDMMRYSLTETKTDGKVELEKEIEQVENLIKVNQFRFNNKLCIKFTLEGNFCQCRIYPLLLVPFVENLFKYAELGDAANPIKITITVEDNLLQFETWNKKRRTINYQSPGIGIQNVKTRLNSYYANRFSLAITDSPSDFSVNLTIEL